MESPDTAIQSPVAILRLFQQEAPRFFSDFETYTAEDGAEAARAGHHKV